MAFRQTRGEVSHAGAAENDHFGPVLSDRKLDFGTDPGGRIRGGIIEGKNRQFTGPHPAAATGQSVFQQVVLDGGDGARRSRVVGQHDLP